jgi:photosystem II PsbW protein
MISTVISPVCAARHPVGLKRQGTSKRFAVTMRTSAPKSQVLFKRILNSTVLTSTLTSVLPALAIVDDRLNGDGTGLPLGINDGALGTILAAVPALVFALYYAAGKQESSIIAGGKNDDSGLSL